MLELLHDREWSPPLDFSMPQQRERESKSRHRGLDGWAQEIDGLLDEHDREGSPCVNDGPFCALPSRKEVEGQPAGLESAVRPHPDIVARLSDGYVLDAAEMFQLKRDAAEERDFSYAYDVGDSGELLIVRAQEHALLACASDCRPAVQNLHFGHFTERSRAAFAPESARASALPRLKCRSRPVRWGPDTRTHTPALVGGLSEQLRPSLTARSPRRNLAPITARRGKRMVSAVPGKVCVEPPFHEAPKLSPRGKCMVSAVPGKVCVEPLFHEAPKLSARLTHSDFAAVVPMPNAAVGQPLLAIAAPRGTPKMESTVPHQPTLLKPLPDNAMEPLGSLSENRVMGTSSLEQVLAQRSARRESLVTPRQGMARNMDSLLARLTGNPPTAGSAGRWLHNYTPREMARRDSITAFAVDKAISHSGGARHAASLRRAVDRNSYLGSPTMLGVG